MRTAALFVLGALAVALCACAATTPAPKRIAAERAATPRSAPTSSPAIRIEPKAPPEPEYVLAEAARPLTPEEAAALPEAVQSRTRPFTWEEASTPRPPPEPIAALKSGDVVLNSYTTTRSADGWHSSDLTMVGDVRVFSQSTERGDGHTITMKRITEKGELRRVLFFDKAGSVTALDDYEGRVGDEVLDLQQPDKDSPLGFAVIRLGNGDTRDLYRWSDGAWTVARYSRAVR